jgi:hypothetical protein
MHEIERYYFAENVTPAEPKALKALAASDRYHANVSGVTFYDVPSCSGAVLIQNR